MPLRARNSRKHTWADGNHHQSLMLLSTGTVISPRWPCISYSRNPAILLSRNRLQGQPSLRMDAVLTYLIIPVSRPYFTPLDRVLDCLVSGKPEWLCGGCPWADTAISTCSASIHLQSGLTSYKAPRRKLVNRYICGAGHYETALRSGCDADVPAPGAGHTSSIRSNRRLLRANGPYRGDVGRDNMTVLAGRGGIMLWCSLARRLDMDLCGE